MCKSCPNNSNTFPYNSFVENGIVMNYKRQIGFDKEENSSNFPRTFFQSSLQLYYDNLFSYS